MSELDSTRASSVPAARHIALLTQQQGAAAAAGRTSKQSAWVFSWNSRWPRYLRQRSAARTQPRCEVVARLPGRRPCLPYITSHHSHKDEDNGNCMAEVDEHALCTLGRGGSPVVSE